MVANIWPAPDPGGWGQKVKKKSEYGHVAY